MISVGGKLFFGDVWGNSRKYSSQPQKFACSYTYNEKAILPSLPPF